MSREGVLSVTGFIDRTGKHFVTRYSRKVCNDLTPLGLECASKHYRRSVDFQMPFNDLGYFGIFEIEFLWFDGAWLAIDFNPRLFHQIGLDIRRGMPLPLLACLDAGGETDTLQNAVKRPKEVSEQGDFVFCDRFLLRAILLKRSLTAQVSRKDRSYWRSWRKRYA